LKKKGERGKKGSCALLRLNSGARSAMCGEGEEKKKKREKRRGNAGRKKKKGGVRN